MFITTYSDSLWKSKPCFSKIFPLNKLCHKVYFMAQSGGPSGNREVYQNAGVRKEPKRNHGKIFIKIVRGKLGNGLKVAIEAPKDVSIVRGELFPGIEEMEARWAKVLGPGKG